MEFEHENLKFESSMAKVADKATPDIKISPDYLMMNALIKAQNVLETEDIKTATSKFTMFIQHIEIIAKSMKLVPPDYKEKLDAYKNSVEFSSITEDYSKHYNLSNYKLGLLMGEIWKAKPVNMPLKV